MLTRTVIASICLGWLAASLQAIPPLTLPERQMYKPVDSETIAAYEKLGAEYGGFVVDREGAFLFFSGKEEAANWLPGFRFQKTLDDGKLPKLPPVQVPFGLSFSWSTSITNAGLKELKDLKNLTTLYLYMQVRVTDAGLKELKEFKSLTTLDLAYMRVTDAGLKELKELKNLTHIGLDWSTFVTEAGLKELKDLKNLKTLSLEGIGITDAGLKDLKNLKCLAALRITHNKKVTEAGLKEFQEAVPKCKIPFD